jgi:HEAT repeat protein
VRISEIVEVKTSIAFHKPWYGEDFGQHIGDELRKLVELHDPQVVPPLIEALRHPSVWVKREAIEALAEIGDPRAIEPLKEKLADWTGYRHSDGEGNWRVSGIAAWALNRIDGGAHDQSSE